MQLLLLTADGSCSAQHSKVAGLKAHRPSRCSTGAAFAPLLSTPLVHSFYGFFAVFNMLFPKVAVALTWTSTIGGS